MAENLSFNLFALIPEASNNENTRPGTLMLEYVQFGLVVDTNFGTAEVPTSLGTVLGIIPLGFSSTFASGDSIHGLTTDGVITTGAISVQATTVSLANATYTTRALIVGYKSDTVLINDPS